jgi:Ser-tRNA(Ala) deacylase AlaX
MVRAYFPSRFQRLISHTLRFQSHTTVGGTRLLYQKDGSLYQHKAKIIAIERLASTDQNANDEEHGSHAIFLDETIFHVRGGGQPFDLGYISVDSEPNPVKFEVKSVRPGEDERIPHVGSFLSQDHAPFKAGDGVTMAIDRDRRLLNSRLHTAGHILGCATMQLSREGKLPPLTETKASHFPDSAAVEFRGLIEGKFKDAIQERADALVAKSLPVQVCFWDRKECEAHGITQFPDKVAGTEEEQIFRTVLIGDQEAYPCGGTHVSDTSGVGKIVVRRISRQKGTSRVSYTVA